MKILLVADIHYALKQYDWLVDRAGDFDLVVIAGDLLEIASSVDRRAQIVVVRAYLERLRAKTRVVVCSGNHDLDGLGAGGDRAAVWMGALGRLGVPSDGQSFRIGGTLFTACSWWDGAASRGDVGDQLARDAAEPKDRWVWIYHAPPADSPVSWAGSRHYGDAELNGWIDAFSPDLVFGGHVHQAPFVGKGGWADRIGGTWVFNSGQQPGPEPARILFDFDEDAAYWFSLEGTERLDLSAPAVLPQAARSLPDWIRV